MNDTLVWNALHSLTDFGANVQTYEKTGLALVLALLALSRWLGRRWDVQGLCEIYGWIKDDAPGELLGLDVEQARFFLRLPGRRLAAARPLRRRHR
eukprot:7453960-Alexandrium_andersonii.AAC.1